MYVSKSDNLLLNVLLESFRDVSQNYDLDPTHF